MASTCWSLVAQTSPLLGGDFVAALKGAVLDIGTLRHRHPELWDVTYHGPTTADAGMLPGARRERARPVEALGIRGVLPIAGNIANDLISRGVRRHTVALPLRHGARNVVQAKAVPCRVIEEPVTHGQAVFVQAFRNLSLPMGVPFYAPAPEYVALNVPSFICARAGAAMPSVSAAITSVLPHASSPCCQPPSRPFFPLAAGQPHNATNSCAG
jgi:hypothetical protein